MNCQYRLSIEARCPVDNMPDRYELMLESPTPIGVESVLAFVAGYRKKKIFQEALTQLVARRFNCRAITTGFHSGVHTTVTAG